MNPMGRRRTNNLALPPRMHLKGGMYYYVTSTTPRKWIKLHSELTKARILWAQVENGDNHSTHLFSTKLDEYLTSPKFYELAISTQKQYESVAKKLHEVFKGATLSSITPAHVAMWLDNHKSPVQANTGKALMSNVFKQALRYDLVKSNPCSLVERNEIEGRDRYITDNEYRAIWNEAPDHVRICMDVGYLTGARIQDILDIRLQDVSSEGVYIKTGKTKKRMLFIMSDALQEVIDRAKSLPRTVRGMSLVCNAQGRKYPYGTFRDHWTIAVGKAGIEGIVFHDIRAKAATDAKRLGMDYQGLLGHSTKAMSDEYIRLREISRVDTLPALVSTKL